jgi:hypothetical protein
LDSVNVVSDEAAASSASSNKTLLKWERTCVPVYL